jgi:hypothetical protein
MSDVPTQRLVLGGVAIGRRARPQIWMSLLLGMYADMDALCSILRQQKCGINDATKEVLKSPALTLTPEVSIIRLVRVSARQLDIGNYDGYEKFHARCLALGLVPCPVEVPVQLRRQYETQPEGELLRVVTNNRIPDSQGRVRFFVLAQYIKKPYLGLCGTGPNTCFGLDDLFVWQKP